MKPHALLQVPFSLAAVLPADSFSWFALLNAFNLFEVLYAVLLGVGISAITGLRWWKSAAVSAAVWGLSATANVALLTVLNESMHFRM